MIRIRIEYDNISPFLRTMSGILYVEKVDTTYRLPTIPIIDIFKCKITKTDNTMGFCVDASEKGIPTKIFECLKPIVDTMLQSYWKGLVLSKDDYKWVQMKGDDSWQCLDQLEKEVGIYLAQRTQDGINKDEVLLED